MWHHQGKWDAQGNGMRRGIVIDTARARLGGGVLTRPAKADGVNWVGVGPEVEGETARRQRRRVRARPRIACGAVVSGPISGLACAGSGRQEDARRATPSLSRLRHLRRVVRRVCALGARRPAAVVVATAAVGVADGGRRADVGKRGDVVGAAGRVSTATGDARCGRRTNAATPPASTASACRIGWRDWRCGGMVAPRRRRGAPGRQGLKGSGRAA